MIDGADGADDTAGVVMVVADGIGAGDVRDTGLSSRLLQLLSESVWILSDCRVQGTSSEPQSALLKDMKGQRSCAFFFFFSPN